MDQPNTGFSEPRAEPFAFACSRCGHCCRHKRIQINPYEVARLARHLGLATSEFRARHTEDGEGTALRQKPGGDCEFLGAEGCTVHADRPLVCRLYPLGRRIGSDSSESFRRLEPHPLSRGTFGTDGTVGAWLEAQDTAPFIRAADAYFEWLCRAEERLGETGADPDRTDGDDILDMDGAIAAHCTRLREEEPADIEARRELHMVILEASLNDIAGDTS